MIKQRGVGLPEMLIALLLAMLISTITLRHYVLAKHHYLRVQTALEESDEWQGVIELIRDSSRKAGFTPCVSLSHLITLDTRNDAHGLTALKVGPQTVHIHRMSEVFDVVLERPNPSEFIVTNEVTIRPGRPVLIADCFHAEVHQVKATWPMKESQRVVLSKPLAFVYHPPIFIGEWVEEQFFVAKKAHAKGALFYHRNHTDELTDVIQTMRAEMQNQRKSQWLQIRFGLERARTITVDTRVRAQ